MSAERARPSACQRLSRQRRHVSSLSGAPLGWHSTLARYWKIRQATNVGRFVTFRCFHTVAIDATSKPSVEMSGIRKLVPNAIPLNTYFK